MKREFVQSTTIQSVGYDPASQTLEIEFLGGEVYEYYQVPPSVHMGLIEASSKGSYFHEHIKDRYEYRKIG